MIIIYFGIVVIFKLKKWLAMFFFLRKNISPHMTTTERREKFFKIIIGITLSMEYVLQSPDDSR